MSTDQECLGCGVDFDYDEGACPDCGRDPPSGGLIGF